MALKLHCWSAFCLTAAVGEAFDRSAAVSAAALAAVSAVLAGTGVVVRSMWPNDLLIESPEASGKLVCVLSEFVDGDPAQVVGLGRNIAAVPEVPGAVSLAAASGAVTRGGRQHPPGQTSSGPSTSTGWPPSWPSGM